MINIEISFFGKWKISFKWDSVSTLLITTESVPWDQPKWKYLKNFIISGWFGGGGGGGGGSRVGLGGWGPLYYTACQKI